MKKNALLGLVAVVGLAGIGTALLSSKSDKEVNLESEANSALTNDVEENSAEDKATTLPADVTDNFPLYPEAEISRVSHSTGDDGRVFYTVSLSSADSISQINDWYRQALSQNSWSITGDSNVGGYQIIKGEKDNLRTSLQAAKGEGGTVNISQQIQIRPK